MSEGKWATFWLLVAVAGMVAMWLFISSIRPAFAHDHDNPALDEWYAGLMQPDNPATPCCGKADAYWCDDYYARDGKAYCKITDDRIVPGRPSIAVGTEIEIPDRKLKWDRGNPTGHSIVFVSAGGALYCFVQGAQI